MSDKQSFQRELEKIENFQELVSREGSELFRDELDGKWFNKVKISFETYYEKSETESYDVIVCFPYMWLCVDSYWELINTGMKKLETFAHYHGKENLQNLQKIVRRLKQKDNEGAALEISTLIKFLNDGTLREIEPHIRQKDGPRADALVEIDGRNVLVEATAITKSIVPLGPPRENYKNIVVSIKDQVDQVTLKIQRKYENQLRFAAAPLILIVSLPRPISSDQQTARWAFNGLCSELKSKIGAFVVCDSYKFSHGIAHFNVEAEFGLTGKEKDYISHMLVATTQPL